MSTIIVTTIIKTIIITINSNNIWLHIYPNLRPVAKIMLLRLRLGLDFDLIMSQQKHSTSWDFNKP